MFGALGTARTANNGQLGTLLPAEYIPEKYYAQIIATNPVTKQDGIFACLYLPILPHDRARNPVPLTYFQKTPGEGHHSPKSNSQFGNPRTLSDSKLFYYGL